MSLVQCPEGNYRNEFVKGRFYSCPYSFVMEELVLVRPICDGSLSETIPADIKPQILCGDAFNHTPYEGLKLKGDEEFTLLKSKRRRVVAITNQGIYGLVKIAPVFTLKGYHRDKFDVAQLRNNRLKGLIYLEIGEDNAEERFISLMESYSVYKSSLQPIRLELNKAGIELLDDNIVTMHDLYSDSR